jgi:hypothetical protein
MCLSEKRSINLDVRNWYIGLRTLHELGDHCMQSDVERYKQTT